MRRARTLVLVLAALTALSVLAPATASALIARVSACAPTGWAAPIVPRAAPDITDTLDVPISPALRTDAPTWIDWASCGNAAAGGGWTDALYLDGALISIAGRPLDPRWTAHVFYSLNDGPVWVRGGRHTLMTHADLYAQYLDGPGDLGDDFAYLSYIWPPMSADWGSVAGGPSPPPRSTAAYSLPLNCEARALARPGVWPWCISVNGPAAPQLYLYDDYSSSTAGLTHELGRTTPQGDSLDFLVGGGGMADTVYAAIVREADDTAGEYRLYGCDAETHVGGANTSWLYLTLPAGATAQVFRLTLQAGQVCPISLTREGGFADLAFAVFAPGFGGVHALRDALAYSNPRPPTSAVMSFLPPTTGDYPLVVYRTTTADISTAQVYMMGTGSQSVVAAPAPAPTFALALASDVPTHDPARLVFELPIAAQARLAVFDAQGRQVRTLAAGALAAGRHAATWDLRDEAGAPVGAGVYWVRLEQAGRTRTQRLIVLR